jgi:hypothetical protein
MPVAAPETAIFLYHSLVYKYFENRYPHTFPSYMAYQPTFIAIGVSGAMPSSRFWK